MSGLMVFGALAMGGGSCPDLEDLLGNAKYCIEECGATADCDAETQVGEYSCDDGMCVLHMCENNDDCMKMMSGWTTECTAAGDCTGQVCIEAGFCATEPSEYVSCTTMMMADYDTKDIDGNDVTVCANTSYTCTDYMCVGETTTTDMKCPDDYECSGMYPECVDGACQCKDDSCADNEMGGTKCLDDGTCGCEEDADCTGDGMTTCYDGECGCGEDGDCSEDNKVHTATSMVCKEL